MMEQMRVPLESAPQMAELPMHMKIIDVWDDNFFEQMELIKTLSTEFNYIAMDTEFPGVVEVPRKKTDDYQYQLCKVNVDTLKIIQLGITLFDENGNVPPGPCTWQFNFKFDVDTEKSLKQSIDVLREAGINFPLHKTKGIDHMLFAEYFLTSGLVLNDELTWICFQGNYDFGYMYRVLVNTPLPDSEEGFLEDTKAYFPLLYDLKYMKEEFEDFSGGLSRLCEILGIERFGQQHQAGSDSWMTGLCFFKLKEYYFSMKNIEEEFNGVINGLGKARNNKEYYLDQYTSKTEQLEREAREYQQLDDHYMHHDQYNGYPYYSMNPNPMEYNEHMMQSYGYNNQMLHPSQQMQHMHAGYNISPNHIEYAKSKLRVMI